MIEKKKRVLLLTNEYNTFSGWATVAYYIKEYSDGRAERQSKIQILKSKIKTGKPKKRGKTVVDW